MRLTSIDLKKINIHDGFWTKHVQLVKDVIIPYQWDAINDRIEGAMPSHSIENFRIAAGLSTNAFHGVVFQDTDVAKWLEAVGFELAHNKDPKLEQIADETIDLIGKAQCEDGYLNTYFTIVEPEKKWKDLGEGHELYTAGHLMEAACAYYQGTGKDKFLRIVEKNADLICRMFGPEEGKLHGYPGHQEVEIGLIKLYRATGKKRYLDTAKYFIDHRGVGENYFLKEMSREDFTYIFPDFQDYQPVYSQSHIPVREQMTAEGHAVRAVYMYTAMAELAYEYHDEELMQACKRLWDNIVYKRMFLTGSIGSSGILERFTTDYDLPNDCNYSETCAAIGLMMFAKRMANITREAKYIDVLEKALYNTVLSGIALDGKSFFYVNPLEVWPDNCMVHTSKEHVKANRQKWFGVACCPPNIARTLASLGQYIYSADESSLYIQLFISNQMDFEIDGKQVHVEMETKFPWENTVKIHCTNVPQKGFKLAVRIPEYAQDFSISNEGAKTSFAREKGYAVMNLTKDTQMVVSFRAPASFIRSNPKVRANNGKTAIVRGPMVYCFEEADNGKNLSSIFLPSRQEIVEKESNIPCKIIALELKGKKRTDDGWTDTKLYDKIKPEFEDISLHAIPYAYWNNRGENEMCVWMKEWHD